MISMAIVDNGPKFKKEFLPLLKELGIWQIITSLYNPKANSINKRRHYSISIALKKIERKGKLR